MLKGGCCSVEGWLLQCLSNGITHKLEHISLVFVIPTLVRQLCVNDIVMDFSSTHFLCGCALSQSYHVTCSTCSTCSVSNVGWAQLMEEEMKGWSSIGVVGAIVPWNFPLMLLSWKVGGWWWPDTNVTCILLR